MQTLPRRLRSLLLVLLAAAAAPLPAAERPNFVFFITDDISPDDLSVYGNQTIQTPQLERWAERGLVFDNAYLTISSCSPSRCSIITGRYPHNTGAPELHTSLPKDQVTFVQTLRDAGYYTVISGKNHMAKPEQLGFAASSDGKPSGCEKWAQHLRDRPRDQPFFCWFASHDAHWPYSPTVDHGTLYKPDEIPVPPMLCDGPATRLQLAQYYQEVSRTDYYAGQLFDELQRQGLLDNTYFIYCADNGRPFPRCKTYLYNSGIQTPLIVAGPGVTRGRTKSLVSSVDYAATILELAGVTKSESVQGISFARVLADPTAATRDVAFAERNWHVYANHERAVRMGDWLYVRNFRPDRHNVSGESAWFQFPAVQEYWDAAEAGKLTDAQLLLTSAEQPAELLFNVTTDPHQFTNLATTAAYADVRANMSRLLDQWIDETGDSHPANPTPDRQGLHESKGGDAKRGEFPGASRGAERINSPGPVRAPGTR